MFTLLYLGKNLEHVAKFNNLPQISYIHAVDYKSAAEACLNKENQNYKKVNSTSKCKFM